MTRTLSEEKVLKKLGIEDFRHLSKANVMQFASMLPRMDKEVAIKALEQFPDYAGLAKEAMQSQFDLLRETLNSSTATTETIMTSYERRLEMLAEKARDPELSFDDFLEINQLMRETQDDMRSLKKEDFNEKLKILSVAGSFVLVLLGAVGAALGSNTKVGPDDFID